MSQRAEFVVLASAHVANVSEKLRRRLQDLKHTSVPVASTITEILRHHGQLDERSGAG